MQRGVDVFSRRMYVRLARRDIAVFKFLLESWDNLAYLSILDKHTAVLQIRYTPSFGKELLDFLDQAGCTVDFRVEYVGL